MPGTCIAYFDMLEKYITRFGFTYATLDHYILTGECEDENIKNKIDRMHRLNLHKLQLMPSFPLKH